jgi:hypothetical protein
MANRVRHPLPVDVDLMIDELLLVSRLVREKTDEVLRGVIWLYTQLCKLFGSGRLVAPRHVVSRVRKLNQRIYEITGEFVLAPSEIFPVETPSPYLSDVSEDDPSTSLWPRGNRSTL